MGQTETNVSAAKPAVGGAISAAPAGTTLPTDATTALASDFKGLGYISEDGVVKSGVYSAEKVKAWGGDVVLQNDSSEKQVKFTLIEAMNADALKFTFGDDNVSGSISTGLHVKVGDYERPEQVLVIDEILKGGILKRTVIPRAIIATVGDINENDKNPIGYEVTVLANKDSDGDNYHEYFKAPAANG